MIKVKKTKYGMITSLKGNMSMWIYRCLTHRTEQEYIRDGISKEYSL